MSLNGIPYYQNGVATYLKPTGGIIATPSWNPPILRTANNAGLRGLPNQIWVVNSNGDGQAVNLGTGLSVNVVNGVPGLDCVPNIVPGIGIGIVESPESPTTVFIDSTVVPVRMAVPLSSSAQGNVGNIAFDNSFFYICIATNTWLRAALSTW